MRLRLAILLITALACLGQTTGGAPTSQARLLQENNELSQALGDAGQSMIDRAKAFEHHIEKYPDSAQRATIERSLLALAMEMNDKERIVLYGEKVLAMGGQDDMKVLDKLTAALVETGTGSLNQSRLKRAVEYARRYRKAAADWQAKGITGPYTLSAYTEELNRITARALALEANATGGLGNSEEAGRLALQSWQTQPTAEGARTAGYWLAKLGRNKEAIEYYADAFAMDDAHNTQLDRARDRAALGALYIAQYGSEKGLGDAVLAAYDRSTALLAGQKALLRSRDPNAEASKPLDFTLPAPDGPPLVMASLKGKTIVMDFWATWCAPCKVQHPMIENVRKKLGNPDDVVFLSIDTDEDRSLVRPFLKEIGWDAGNVYFQEGMSLKLMISAIPTVLIVDSTGEISSRLAGFVPDRFENLLLSRIQEARQKQQTPDKAPR